MKVKEESENVGLKLNIPKAKSMASGPITSWGNNGNNDRLYFLGLKYHCICPRCIFLGIKTIADGDYSHEIKRHLFLGRKAMTNLDNVLKSRNIILPTKVYLIKAMVFPYELP